jgi:hypothetical protein
VKPATRRMWEGGPLRQWAERDDGRQATSWTRYQNPTSDGYAGCYVCDECQEPVGGVYRHMSPVRWICAACREALPSRGKRQKGST